jgi:hypothetical protein
MFDSFVSLGVLFILLLGFRGFFQLVRSWMLNRTIRQAIEKQPEAVPAMLDRLGSADDGWRQDAVGWGLTGAGFAIAVAAIIGDPRDRIAFIQIALMPLFVGFALLIHWFIRSRHMRRA